MWCGVILVFLINKCTSNEPNNYYVQQWIEPSYPQSTPAWKKFEGNNYFATISPRNQGLGFIGPPNRIYLSSNDTPPYANTSCAGCLPQYIQSGSKNPSNFIPLGRFMYFTSKDSGNSQNNFYIWDSSSWHYTIPYDFGNIYENYTKPFSTSDECYTTDGEKYIYIIGGTSGANLKTFSILDTTTNTFSVGPNLNYIRAGAACIYSHSNNKLYIFGGSNLNTVEVYYSGLQILWEMVNVTLSQTTDSISAFIIKNSNTAFIIGGTGTGIFYNEICNQFFIDTERMYLCIKRPKKYPNFAPIYIENLQRFWTFGGCCGHPANQSMQYIEPNNEAPLSLLSSTITINIGETVPIRWNINENYVDLLNTTCNFTLYSESLNVSNLISINPKSGACFICGQHSPINTNHNCWECSLGLLPQYSKPTKIYDIIDSNSFYIKWKTPQLTYCMINSFYVTLNNILSINISLPTTISTTMSNNKIPILFNGYILKQFTNYQWILSSSLPNAAKIDHLLTIITNSNNIKLCTIMDRNTSEIATCNQGFEPKLNYTQIAINNSTFDVIFTSSNGNATQIEFFPTDRIPIIVQDLFISFSNNTFKLYPGGRVSINISNYALSFNQLYQFDLQSINSKVQVNYLLNIQTGNISSNNNNQNGTALITDCFLGSTGEPNPTPCNIGVKPIIEYDGTFDTFDISITPSTITNLNSKYVYITPQNGIKCELTMCEPGFGIRDKSIANCELCPSGEFTLVHTIDPCYQCKGELNGIECAGGSDVQITYNYWVSAVGKNKSKLYPLITILSSDEIYSAFCPPGYCCNDINGCNYLDDTNKLCSYGRNVNSTLCGQCQYGLSELFGSTSCGKCHQTNYLFFFLVFLLIVFPFTIYIAYFESVPKYDDDENDDINNSVSRSIELFSTLIFDIGVYYFQSLSIILLSSGLTVSSMFESIILSFFSLSPSTVGNGETNGYCIIANLDSFGKLLTNLLFPLLFIPCLIFLAVINNKTNWTLADILCFSCYKINRCNNCLIDTKFHNFLNRRAFMFKCFMRILLLYAGTALSTLFQIITFIKLGNGQTVHFYAPTKQIDGFSVTLSIIFILIIIGIFGMIWRNLYKQTNEERFCSDNNFQNFVLSFKWHKWYWQFIILSRRCIIAIIAALQYLSPNVCNLILAAYIIIYSFFHIEIKPFHSNIANHIETLCLLSLILVLLCLNFNIENGQFFGWFISINIAIPAFSFFIFAIICIHKWCKSENNCFKKLRLNISMSSSLNQKYVTDGSLALLVDNEIGNDETDETIKNDQSLMESAVIEESAVIDAGISIGTESQKDQTSKYNQIVKDKNSEQTLLSSMHDSYDSMS